MPEPTHVHPADVHGVLRLAADATRAVTDIVEAMHEALLRPPLIFSGQRSGRTRGIPALAYSSVRGVAQGVGAALDLVMAPVSDRLGARPSTPGRDGFLSALSGVVGDHLAESGNPLAVPMQIRRGGRALDLSREAVAARFPAASPRIALFVHGLCGSDAQWKRAAFDYPRALEQSFGFTPLYLRYNSGLHISTNGRQLAALLEELHHAWPVPLAELLVVGHSMGGLVARSALHYAASRPFGWPATVRRMAFLGSPHHGAPLERGGNFFEEVLGSIAYAAPIARLGRLRSAGITDLRHGNIVDEDWLGSDRFVRGGDGRRPLPLPQGVDCLALAATTGSRRGDAKDRLIGDGLVPVASALGRHRDPRRTLEFPESRRRVVYRMHHMKLLGHPDVYRHLANWLEDS